MNISMIIIRFFFFFNSKTCFFFADCWLLYGLWTTRWGDYSDKRCSIKTLKEPKRHQWRVCLTTFHRDEDGASPQTGAAVGSVPLQQLAAVEAAVVQLQLLQAQVVGDASRARSGRQADPLRWKLRGGWRAAAAMETLRVVQHLHRRVASLPL